MDTEQLARNEPGLNNRVWQQSGLLAAISALPSDLHIYTNEPQAVYFHLARPALSLPSKFDTLTGQVVGNFSARLDSIEKQMQQRNAVVAYFRFHDWPHLPPEDDVAQLPSLVKLKETGDGAIYGDETLRGMLLP